MRCKVMQKYAAINSQQLDTIIAWTGSIAMLFDYLAQVAEALQSALIETKRMRAELKAGEEPLDWDAFIKRLFGVDSELAELLANVDVKKFNRGQLWVKSSDSTDYARLGFYKDWLMDYLRDTFGCTFRVRIKHYQTER